MSDPTDLPHHSLFDREGRHALRILYAVDAFQMGVLLEDEQRRVALTNAAFCALLRIDSSPAELVGRDAREVLAAASAQFANSVQALARAEQIVAGGHAVFSDELLLADGRVVKRDYMPIRSGDDLLGHLWQYRDVTESVRARQRQQRLYEIEHLLFSVAQWMLSADSLDTALNHALEQIGRFFEISRAYVFRFREGERLVDNTHEWCAPGVEPQINRLQGLAFDDVLPSFFPMMMEQGQIISSDMSDLPEDIRLLLEEQDIKAIILVPLIVNGRLDGFLGFDETRGPREWLPEEITTLRAFAENYARAIERKRTEEALVLARDEALKSARLKTEFMSNMSHEIRTPMTSVLGMLELLRETKLDETQRDFAETAYESSHKLLGIINDVLDFAKIEAGKVAIEQEVVDVAGIVTEVQMTLANIAQRKGITLSTDIAPDIAPRVLGDSTRIRQVLMNFASNAVKFTRHGGVVLRLRKLSGTAEKVLLRFEVIDSGIGIPEDQLGRIFESFTQADGTVTRKFGGTGLGLTISKQLVELMGGEIDVTSAVGAGSVFGFNLLLPIAPQALEAARAHAQTPRRARPARLVPQKGRILLAEDNHENRLIVRDALENAGYEIGYAQNGQEVLEQFRAKQFDLVLMDIQMPVMDGIEAAQRLRAEGYSVPIIAITASVLPHQQREYLKAGMNAVLPKPFTISGLRSTVEAWIAKKPTRE